MAKKKPGITNMEFKEEVTAYVLGEVSKLLASLDFSKIAGSGGQNETPINPMEATAVRTETKMAPKEKAGRSKPPTLEDNTPNKDERANTSANTHKSRVDSDEVISLKAELAKCKKEIRELRSKVAKLETEKKTATGGRDIAKVSKIPTLIERKKNIIIQGVPEVEGEKIETTVGNFLESAGCTFDWKVVSRAYRLGRKRRDPVRPAPDAAKTEADNKTTTESGPDNTEVELVHEGKSNQGNVTPKPTYSDITKKQPRGIKLHLQNREQCQQIYGARTKINDKAEYKHVSMRPDSSRDDMMAERTVQQIYTLAKTNPKVTSAKMRGKSIEINGVLYREYELGKIEIDGISPSEAAIREFDWGTCFQGHNAPLSNFYRCKIRNKMGNKTFSSAEQYYCSVMANYHEQFETQRLIEATENPYAIKAIAKRIRRTPEWYARSEKVLADIVRAKFDQNPELKKKLLAYKGAAFRECTKCPYWGAGIFLSQATNTQPDAKGYKNNMGKILENIRDAYRQQTITSL